MGAKTIEDQAKNLYQLITETGKATMEDIYIGIVTVLLKKIKENSDNVSKYKRIIPKKLYDENIEKITKEDVIKKSKKDKCYYNLFDKHDGGKTVKHYQWEILLEILNELIEQNYLHLIANEEQSLVHKTNEKKIDLDKQIVTNSSARKKIIFALPKFQETLLPALYKSNLNKFSEIKFQDTIEWSDCLNKLNHEDIDMAIHNFPTVLSYIFSKQDSNSMFFWPLLTFNGYALFVNKKAIDKYCTEKNYKGYNEIKRENKNDFFSKLKISLDGDTDFEYILKEFCEKNEVKWDVIQESIFNENLIKGKKEFIKHTRDVYITNSINLMDLKNYYNDDFELIVSGTEFTRHHNYNGLICSMKFYNENRDLVKNFINEWYNNLEYLKLEWDLIKLNGNETINYFQTHSLFNYLSKEYFTKITINEFVEGYKYNEFFNTAKESYDSFINAMNDNTIKNRNINIANMQLSKDNMNKSNELFEQFLETMKRINTEINL